MDFNVDSGLGSCHTRHMSQATVVTGPAILVIHRLQFLRAMGLEMVLGGRFSSKGNLWQTAALNGYITARTRYTKTQKVAAMQEIIDFIREIDPTYELSASLKRIEGLK